jgi:hypothetical protein
MKRVLYIILAMIFLSLLFSNYCLAQHFINLTDKAKIEMGLNLIRKGIQQKDTAMVLNAIYPDFEVKGNTLSRKELNNKLLNIFDNSKSRKTVITKPSFPGLTDLWDFDILNWQIDVQKDLATVDCELVFWGTEADTSVSKAGGRKVKERLVFEKREHFWGLAKSYNLLLFLEEYGAISSSQLVKNFK